MMRLLAILCFVAAAGCNESIPTKSSGTPEDLKREADQHRKMRENESKNR